MLKNTLFKCKLLQLFMSEMPKKFLSLDLKTKSLHEHYRRGASEAHTKIANYWQSKGENISTYKDIEIVFPNYKPKANGYSVDIILDDYFLMVEIDGDSHLNRKGKDEIRDNHLLRIAKAIDPRWDMKRIPLSIPREYLYGQLQGDERERVKTLYIKWLNKLASDNLVMIQQEFETRQNRWRLEKLKNS